MNNFKIIDNVSETMGITLPPMIRKSTELLYCGIGYFLNSGYKNIQDEIIDIANNGADVKIIAGNLFIQQDGIPKINPYLDKETYELIVNIHEKSNGMIELESIKEQFFHGKFFLGLGKEKAYFIGGSSNMSYSGMSSKGNIEYNLYSTQDIDSDLIVKNKEWFELMKGKASSFSQDNIEEIKFLLNKMIFGIDVQEDIKSSGSSIEKTTIEIQCEIIDKMLKNVGLNTETPIMSESNKNEPKDIFVFTIFDLYQNRDKDELKSNQISKIIENLCYNRQKSEKQIIEELTNRLKETAFTDYYWELLNNVLKQKASKGIIPDYSTFLTDMVNLFDEYYNKYHKRAFKKGSYNKTDEEKHPRMNTKDIDGMGKTFYPPKIVSDNRAEYLLEAIRSIRGSFDDSWLFQFQTFDSNILVERYSFLEKGAYIAHEAGMGKSPIMCKFIKEIQLQNRDTRVLIAVPASLMTQWQDDNLMNDFGISSEIVDRAKLNSEGNSIWTNRRVNICSIDFLKNFIATETDESFIKAMSPDVLVVDEAHLLKNIDSGRYTEISKLSPKFVLLASATPLQNEVKEFLAQLKIIDKDVIEDNYKDLSYVNDLKDKYVIRRTRKHDLVEIKEIKQAVRKVEQMEVSLTPKFKDVYDELEARLKNGELYYYKFLGELKEDSRRYKNIDSMSSFMMLQGLTSSTQACIQSLLNIKNKIKFIIDSKFKELSEEKINEYDTREEREILSMLFENKHKITEDKIELLKQDINLIDEFINPNTGKLYESGKPIRNPKEEFFLDMIDKTIVDKQVIVFVKYINTGKSLKEELESKGLSVGFYEGSLSRQQRKILIEEFKADEIQILICTDAANAGLNLQSTNILFNYDLNWNPQIVEQRIGRVHRIGQKSAEVRIFNLVLKDTIDGRVQELMKTKEETFNNIFDTSDTILGEIAKQYMKGDLENIVIEEESQVAIRLSPEDEILTENKKETSKLNDDYYYIEAALRELLMWVIEKHKMSYSTDDNETYYIKLPNGEVQQVHITQVYNMIEDEDDFFRDFNITPIANRKIKEYEKDIEGFYFGKELQLTRHIHQELDKVNASEETREDIEKIITECKNKSLLLLNLNVEYEIELYGDIFRRNEFQTIIITPEYDLYSNIDVARLFYIVSSEPIGTERIDVVKNGANYITMYNNILRNRLIADKQRDVTNNDIIIKDVDFEIYNGTIIEIN